MKLLMENWNKFLNEEEQAGPDISQKEIRIAGSVAEDPKAAEVMEKALENPEVQDAVEKLLAELPPELLGGLNEEVSSAKKMADKILFHLGGAGAGGGLGVLAIADYTTTMATMGVAGGLGVAVGLLAAYLFYRSSQKDVDMAARHKAAWDAQHGPY